MIDYIEANIKAYEKWHEDLLSIKSLMSFPEIAAICKKIGVSHIAVQNWFRGNNPNLGLWVMFMREAFEYIKKRDLLKNNIEGVSL